MSLHNPISPLRALYVQKVLPAVYDDSLSYYEVLAKTQEKLNEVISDTNEVSALVLELQQAIMDFIHGGYTDTFEEYLDEWFADNADEFVQRLIDDGVIPEVSDIQNDLLGVHSSIEGLQVENVSLRNDMVSADNELQAEDASIRNDMTAADIAIRSDMLSADTAIRNDMDAADLALANTKVPYPIVGATPSYGTSGQVLATNADGTTVWQDAVVPSDAQAEQVITQWLNAHPEATTTVQDGAVTTAKIYNGAVTTDKLADDSVTDEKLVQSGGVLDKVSELKGAFNDTTDLVVSTQSGSGSSLIKLENTIDGELSVILSGNSGTAKVVSCGKNLANVANLEMHKNWNGSDNYNRARLRIKVKPNTYFTIKFSGIGSGFEVAVFELKTYNGTSATTSHSLTMETAATFRTYGDTLWLSLLINKGAPLSDSDVSGLKVYCNEGTSIIEEDFVGDMVQTSSNATLKSFLNTTYIYTTDDDANIVYNYKKYIDFFPSLIVCGYDAEYYAKGLAKNAQSKGWGYVCNDTELDSGINAFIDKFIDVHANIFFYGTIITSEGIHKHPKHNLYGYNCTLKMGDNLGSDYISCVRPTNGGVPFSTKQVISHNNTCVKGFTFDGNCENNKVNNSYVTHSLYGGTICGEWYNNETYPYDQTQLMSDIVLEDIRAINTMRGIIVGIGWKCRNLYIEKAVTDHALYLAGADQAIVDNCYCTGLHKNGTIAISSQSWDATRKVRNIHLKNITVYEPLCPNGPILDIRGHFSTWGNNNTLDDIFIDGLFIKQNVNSNDGVAVAIGTYSGNEHGSYTIADYPMNIQISNLVADMKLHNSFARICNARTNLKNAIIRFKTYRYARALFQLESRDIIKKVFDFSSLTIISDETEDTEHAWTIFGIINTAEDHKHIHGLNLDDLYIEGISNYYLFHLAEPQNTTYVRINDVSAERIVATPLGTVNPDSDRILFVANDYYQMET